MAYLHVQFNIFLKYETWEFKANILYWYDQLFTLCDVWLPEGLDNSSK